MKILFLGDVVAEPGLLAVKNNLPALVKDYDIDVVIANGENVTNGAGISIKDYRKLIDYGVDVVTLGNHYFKFTEIQSVLESEESIIRPYNYFTKVGRGVTKFTTRRQYTIIIANIALRRDMGEEVQCPFKTADMILSEYKLEDPDIDAIFVDIHGSSGFEKKALAYYCDGKVSAMIGTHTHVATNDACILPNGTAFQADVGMCGSKDSCCGAEKSSAINSLLSDNISLLRTSLTEPYGLCCVYVQVSDATKLATEIKPLLWQ